MTRLTGQGKIDNLRAMIENGSEIVHGKSRACSLCARTNRCIS
jgi:hypothetical protein